MLYRLHQFARRLAGSSARQSLVAASLCTGITLALAVAWYAMSARQVAIDDAVREMRNDALMAAEDQDRLLQAADVVQRSVIEMMRGMGIASPDTYVRLMRTQAVQQDLGTRIAALPQVSALLLLDRDGTLVNSSRSWPPSLAGEARDFIAEMKAVAAPAPLIGVPSRGTASGHWQFHLSRRFEAADGRTLGYVVSAIDIGYFEQFYARLPLTGGGVFILYRRDGMMLARYPPAEPLIGKNYANTPNFIRVRDATNGGLVRLIGRFDHQDRLVVAYTMPHFPVIAAVSDTMGTVLAGWRIQTRALVVTTALLEAVLAAGVMLLLRHLRGQDRLLAAETARARAEAELTLLEERERATEALRIQQHRFEIAAQNMLQGLLMVSSDNTVLVANRRFHELWGLAPDEIMPGTPYEKLIVQLHNTVAQPDLDVIRLRRAELIARNECSNFLWELSDGRTIAITHQPMVDGWLATYEDFTERRAAEAKIAYLARYDALTDLPNRILFHEALEQALAFARRGYRLALHCLDLDQFKSVNDTLGHPIGDRLLQAVAKRLRGNLRDTDTIARLGGDEFAIVQPGVDAPLDAAALATRLIEEMARPFDIDGHHIVIGTSIGIAFAPSDGMTAVMLLKNADLALYRAKTDGRGVYRLFHAAMDAEMQARRSLELDLRQALARGQFELFYQPLVDLQTQAASGFEALLRWRHPDRGMVPPDKFIPLAEEIGVIVQIGDWVLRQACLAAASWPQELRVCVNLSSVQFKTPALVGTVGSALRDSGLAPDRLELEITETVMLQDTAATLATLHELRASGVGIAMDDFGTGYSSLSYLRRFPFDRIKIDQSFVRELGRQRDCGAIVRAVVGLGRELGMAITAEGVETPEQLLALAQAGCTDIQGYLFSRPVPLSEIPALLRSLPTAEALLQLATPDKETLAA